MPLDSVAGTGQGVGPGGPRIDLSSTGLTDVPLRHDMRCGIRPDGTALETFIDGTRQVERTT